MKTVQVLGAMSGTSIDGAIDVAWLETDGEATVHRKGHYAWRYEPSSGRRPFHRLMKAAEIAVRKASGEVAVAKANFNATAIDYFATQHQLSPERAARELRELLALLGAPETMPANQTLDFLVTYSTDLHVQAFEAALTHWGSERTVIDLIGYHGQTLFHDPGLKRSIQVGLPQRLATRLKVPVVFNFRANDLAHGGQGAPLAPIYHCALAHAQKLAPCVILNLGGCANMTVVGDSVTDLLALDTGPASILIDRFVSLRSGEGMDRDGQLAKQGRVLPPVLAALRSKGVIQNGKNYLDLPCPKSLDARDCVLVPELETVSLVDGAATLTAFTGLSVAEGAALLQQQRTVPTRWIACGGGAYNESLLKAIREALTTRLAKTVTLVAAESVGLSSQGVEAELFAYLAARSRAGLPLSFPGTTGVTEPCLGGELFKP